jgi:hypothetical protein
MKPPFDCPVCDQKRFAGAFGGKLPTVDQSFDDALRDTEHGRRFGQRISDAGQGGARALELIGKASGQFRQKGGLRFGFGFHRGPKKAGAVLQAQQHDNQPSNRIKYFRAAKAIMPSKKTAHPFGIAVVMLMKKKRLMYKPTHKSQSQSIP